MSAYNLWHTNTDATIRTTYNIFTLSKPLNLLLPYSLTLELAIPFSVVGVWALRENGVAATDWGFVQLLGTTTGGDMLSKVARGNCLSGEAGEELANLKIRFGELIGDGELEEELGGGQKLARAGFGVEEEVRTWKFKERGEVWGCWG